MKQRFYFPMVLLAILGLAPVAGCQKSSSQPNNTNAAVVGYWFGTFTATGASAPTAQEGHVFKSDGTMVSYDFWNATSTDTASCPTKGYGTYTISGNKVSQTYSYASAGNFTATCTISGNTMTGPYSGTSSGTLSFTKQ
ncbi:MAG: hypothetical protein JST47_05050 [Bacteroidetes bacterium]|nr:hypothetical protein [Bacteroidota bacterium]MBS1975367.1 hypothetical protein [Bacteroidota bacterium]